jgi:hypothetical protein
MGYKPKESVVSLTSGGWSHWSFMGDLDLLAQAISCFYWSNGSGMVFMNPGTAKFYASKGMSKKDVETYIHKKAAGQMKDQTPKWFTYPTLPGVNDSKDLSGIVKIIVVGGKTVMPNAQVWQFGLPITTSIDKWR